MLKFIENLDEKILKGILLGCLLCLGLGFVECKVVPYVQDLVHDWEIKNTITEYVETNYGKEGYKVEKIDFKYYTLGGHEIYDVRITNDQGTWSWNEEITFE